MSNVIFELFAKLGLDSTEYDNGLNDAEGKASGIGSALSTAASVGTAALATIGTAAIATGASFVAGAGDVASYGDNIDKMSQKMGISAEAYQEWDAIMQHSGTSIDSMSRGMQTLQKNAVNSAEKFEALGISQEQLATMSTEELFSATITGLQNMGEGAERTALASELLGGSAKELGALLNTSAEDTEAMRERVHELGGVMSDDAVKAAAAYQDQLQDMTTAFDSIKRGLMGDFMPSITTVMGGLTELFAGDYNTGLAQVSEGIDSVVSNIAEVAPKVLSMGGDLISALASALLENLPKLLPSLVDLVLGIGDMIIESLPLLINAATQMVLQLATGLAEALPAMIPQIVNMVLGIVDALISNVDLLIDAAIQLALGLATGLVQAIPVIIQKIPEIVMNIVTALVNNAPKLITAAVQLVVTLATGLVQAIPTLISSFGTLITSMVDFVKQTDWIELGKNVITSILDGLMAIGTTLATTLGDLATKALDKVKEIDWLELGKNIITSIGNGIAFLVNTIPQALLDIGNNAVTWFTSVDWLSVGKNLVEGIWNGISGAYTWITEKLTGWVDNVLTFIKGLFGIKSPSTVMRDQVGVFIGEGVAVGIEKSLPAVEDAMEELSGIATQPIEADYTSTYEASATKSDNTATQNAGMFDYEAMANAVLYAFEKSNLTVEMDNREFGRIVRKVVTA